MYTVSMSKPVLFQAIPFSIISQFNSIWLIDRALSSATTPGQNESESDGNEKVLSVPQSSSITEAVPSDYLMSYIRTLVGGSYLTAEMQPVHPAAPANWANVGRKQRKKNEEKNRWGNEFVHIRKGKYRHLVTKKSHSVYCWCHKFPLNCLKYKKT